MSNLAVQEIVIDESETRFDKVQLPEDSYKDKYNCYLQESDQKLVKVEVSGTFINNMKKHLEDHFFVGRRDGRWFPIFRVDEITYSRFREHVAKCAFVATDGFMKLYGKELTLEDEIWYENHPSTVSAGLKENNTLDCLQALALKHGLTISEVVLSKGYISPVDYTPYKDLFKCNMMSDGSPLFTQKDYEDNFPDDTTEYKFTYAEEIVGPAIVFHGKGHISMGARFEASGGHASFIREGQTSKSWEYAIRMAPIEEVPGYETLPADEYTFEGKVKSDPDPHMSKIGGKSLSSHFYTVPTVNRPIWGGGRDMAPFQSHRSRRDKRKENRESGRSGFNYQKLYSRTDALSFWLDLGGDPEDFNPTEAELSQFRAETIWTELNQLSQLLDQPTICKVMKCNRISLKKIYKKNNLPDLVDLIYDVAEHLLVESDAEITVADFAIALNKADDEVLKRLIVWTARACFLESQYEPMV